jgi:hypothetical protein
MHYLNNLNPQMSEQPITLFCDSNQLSLLIEAMTNFLDIHLDYLASVEEDEGKSSSTYAEGKRELRVVESTLELLTEAQG